MDFLNLGSSPWGEPCVQVGESNYQERAFAELNRFIKLLETKLRTPPQGAELQIMRFEHDFGPYYEVVVMYETDNPEAKQYAYYVEGNVPETW